MAKYLLEQVDQEASIQAKEPQAAICLCQAERNEREINLIREWFFEEYMIFIFEIKLISRPSKQFCNDFMQIMFYSLLPNEYTNWFG